MGTGRRARSRTTRSLLAAVTALALLAVACEDDSGGGGSAESSDSDVDAALGEPNPAAGEPVVIGMISASESDSPLSEQFQEAEAGAQIAVDYANEYLMGVGGRPLELFICQGGETPAGSQDCANQMVNEDVAAVVMPFTGNGAAMVPVITGAGIPFVALSGSSSEELFTEGTFLLSSGFPGTLAAFAEHASANDVSKFALLAIDVPGVSEAIEGLGGTVFGNADVEFEGVPAPQGTADMTPQVQAAVDDGADALGMIGDVTFCSSFLQAYQTLALDQPRYLIGTCIDPAVLESYSDLINGSVGTSPVPARSGDPDAEIYAAMAQKYGADEDIDPNPAGSTGYVAG
ncbi:MAG: ABC transporter substrate-binding protein, partial [Acidimicrobiia bacterium]